jgi:outer membrane protein TolC
MKTTRNMLLVAALCAAGCATVREAREAQKEDSRLNGEKVATYAETGLPPDGAVTVAQLAAAALTNSPAILQARQAVIAAQIAVRDAKAAYLPAIDAAAGYTYQAAKVSPDADSTHDGAWGGSASLTMLAYDFGKSRAAKRKAVLDLIAAERGVRTAENATLYAIRAACYELRRDIELRDVAAETAAVYAEHLQQMKDRHEVGAVNSYAVSKAAVDWAQSALTAVTASNAVLTARAALNAALSIEGAPELTVADDEGIRTYEGLSADDLMEIARTNAPALASLRASAEGASRYVDYTVANLYPSLGVSIQYKATYDESTLLWQLVGAGQLTQSVFCGGRKKRMIEAAVAQLRIARSKVAQEELSLHNSLITAVLASIRAQQQLKVAIESRDLAEENLRIVNERYSVGKASELERSDAQVALSSAKATVVSAKYDYYDSQILISRLIGE